MRVLLLADNYPPDPAVGAIRAGNVVRALEARGHEVVVIAAASDAPPQEGVHRISPLPNATELYRRVAGRGRGRTGGGTGGTAAAPEKRSLPRWKRLALSLLLLPDERQGYIWPAVRLGRRLAAEPFDLLVTTAPPHSVTVSGLVLKGLTRLPWVAELRDPWVDNAIRPPYHNRVRTFLLGLLEAASLRAADLVVPVTDATGRLLKGRVRDPDKIRLIRNGVPPAPAVLPAADEGMERGSAPAVEDGEVYRIVHTGTLYGNRDPRPLIEAIASLRARTGPDVPPIQLEFAGNCASYEPLIRAAAERLPAPDRVVLHGSVSRAAAARITASADLLLLLAQQQPLQVPQKLYDYLASRRPILAFVDREGESAAMLAEVGGHYAVYDHQCDGVLPVLEAAVRQRDEPLRTEESVLGEWAVEAQMAHLVALMESVAAGARGGRPPTGGTAPGADAPGGRG